MKKSIKFLPLLSMGLVVVGCQDYDAGFTESDIKAKQYANDFQKTFGNVDPNQDWSMAANIKANVAISGNAQVLIYSENPAVADNAFIGFVDSQHTSFNAVKGLDQVYGVVKVNGKTVVSGYYNVENNAVTFSMETAAKHRAVTRAGSATCSVYEGDGDGKVNSTVVRNNLQQTGTVPYPIQWMDGTSDENKMSNVATFDYDLYSTQWMTNIGSSEIGNFYIVDNPSFTQKVNRKLADMYDLFYEYETKSGEKKEAVFHETTNHVKPYMGKSVEENEGLEKDAFFVTKGGEPVTMTLVGKGTNKKNDVGYFYYPLAKESEYLRADGTLDFDKVNKYVLITDASNSHDLLQGANAYGITDKVVYKDYNQFQQAVQKAGTNADNWGASIEWKDAEYECTVVTLPFFGDAENPTSETEDFPADYVVGFFMVQPTAGAGERTHLVCSYANVELNYFNDYPRGAAFQYLGKTYLGLEDDADYDINDYVFEIGGVKGDKPDITPPDHKEYKHEESTSWLFACEDLGGTFDYDFNDVVWEFKVNYTIIDVTDFDPNTGEDGGSTAIEVTGAEINILAAGGTLPAHLYYDSEDLGEVHEVLGGVSPSDLYSTINASSIAVAPKTLKTFDADEATEIFTNEDVVNNVFSKFSIEVTDADGDSHFVTSPAAGAPNDKTASKIPEMILVPGQWEWPTENTCIKEAYDGFTNWANDASWDSWCLTKQAGKTVSR